MFHVQKNTDISGIKEENIQYMRCRTSEMWKMWCLMPFRQAWYGAASVQGDQGSVNQQCYHAGLGLFHSCNRTAIWHRLVRSGKTFWSKNKKAKFCFSWTGLPPSLDVIPIEVFDRRSNKKNSVQICHTSLGNGSKGMGWNSHWVWYLE